MIKKDANIDGVKKLYKELEIIELKKMYSEVDIEDKYILFVKSELWFPFDSESIVGAMEFIFEDGIKSYPIKTRTPYLNKTLSVIDMKNKRNICNYGVPIIFDSFEELEKLNNVKIKWIIETEEIENKNVSFHIKIDYKLNFIKEEGKFIYSINTKDTMLDTYERIDMEDKEKFIDNYISEFDNITIINNLNSNDGENYSYCIKGNLLNEEEIVEEIFGNIGIDGLYNSLIDKYIYNIYLYSREENLKPDTVARDILH